MNSKDEELLSCAHNPKVRGSNPPPATNIAYCQLFKRESRASKASSLSRLLPPCFPSRVQNREKAAEMQGPVSLGLKARRFLNIASHGEGFSG